MLQCNLSRSFTVHDVYDLYGVYDVNGVKVQWIECLHCTLHMFVNGC